MSRDDAMIGLGGIVGMLCGGALIDFGMRGMGLVLLIISFLFLVGSLSKKD